MPCCALHRHARFAFAVLILACVTLAAPVHIVLPDVVTLQGGNTVTLYSPPSRRLDTLQTDPAADDAIISINQDMLLHALVPSLNVDDPDDGTSSAAPDTRPDLAFDHSKNLDVIAQLSANVEDNANDNIFGTSSSWEKLPISNKRTSSTSLRPTTPRSKSSRSSTSTSMSETNTATSFTSDHDLSSSPTRSTKKSAKPTSTGTAASSDSASLSTDTPTTAQTSSARLVNTSHTRTVELSIQTDLGDTKSGLYPETSTRKQARSSPSPTPSTTLSSEAGSEEASSLATPALSTTSTSPVSASTALHTSTAPRLLGGGIWDSLLATSSASSLPSAIAPSTGLLASSKSATNALSSSNTLQQPASSTDSGVVVIPLTQVPPKQLSDPSSTSLATSAASEPSTPSSGIPSSSIVATSGSPASTTISATTSLQQLSAVTSANTPSSSSSNESDTLNSAAAVSSSDSFSSYDAAVSRSTSTSGTSDATLATSSSSASWFGIFGSIDGSSVSYTTSTFLLGSAPSVSTSTDVLQSSKPKSLLSSSTPPSRASTPSSPTSDATSSAAPGSSAAGDSKLGSTSTTVAGTASSWLSTATKPASSTVGASSTWPSGTSSPVSFSLVSMQQIGSLSIMYPFTTSIPLLVATTRPADMASTASASATSSSIDKHASSSLPEDTATSYLLTSSTAIKDSDTAASSSSFTPTSSPTSYRATPTSTPTSGISKSANPPLLFSAHITSPVTLGSDDVVEVVFSHASLPTSRTEAAIETSSDPSGGTVGMEWPASPAAISRLEISPPTDLPDSQATNLLPKRSPKTFHTRGFSSKTRITTLDAVRSAQSLISAMRDVATRSDNDSPTRQSQISVIRSVLGQQFVFPEDMAADDDDIDALPTVTQEVYGTVYTAATNRHAPVPVVYQNAIQPHYHCRYIHDNSNNKRHVHNLFNCSHNCQCYNYGYNYCDEHSHHNIYNFIKRHHHNDNINNTNSNNNYYYHVISVAVDNHIYVYNY